MDFESIYAEFLNELEAIAADHHELTDTTVRERLREVINYYFVWGHKEDKDFPQCYGMFSVKGDQKIVDAVRQFLDNAKQVTADVALGDDRNYLLENFDIETENGAYFDEFIGSADEALNDEPPSSDRFYGNYMD